MRSELAALIARRLGEESGARQQFADGSHFVVDDLLPPDLALDIYKSFPSTGSMMLRSSIRERKYVSSQMDRCAKLMEEAVFAFQEPVVVDAVSRITGLPSIEPDARLYAGGISAMTQGHYLHPHLDNSHDMERARYRVLNLLYYCSPGWQEEAGGNFELWPQGPSKPPLTIHSRFNRLLVIATNRSSWHSVSKVSADASRLCVSNYYFSKQSPEGEDYFHVTSFRGRPEQPLVNLVLRTDAALRMLVRRVFRKGVVRTKHYYR